MDGQNGDTQCTERHEDRQTGKHKSAHGQIQNTNKNTPTYIKTRVVSQM